MVIKYGYYEIKINPYGRDMTVTKLIFIKFLRAQQVYLKYSDTKFHAHAATPSHG
jgi:hypothetical protein